MYEKRTKIICTISDRNCSEEFIGSLYREGMNVARLNTAHITLESASEVVRNIRKVSDSIAILVDTKGPEVRLTAMDNEGGFEVQEGEIVNIGDGTEKLSSRSTLYTNYDNFVEEVPVHASILIDDGEIALKVIEKDQNKLICRVENGGVIKGRKSINIPGVSLKLQSVTPKDREFILWAIKENVDFIAHSFVRNADDLHQVQTILDQYNSTIKIVSKIENQEGVDNIEEIIDNCYGVMVARGDLGVEIEAEKIPVIQRMIIEKCRLNRRPVIIATQMLHTMIEHPRPTRAEVSDVANAVYQRTDAIMLSGETANGLYPVEAVKTMATIAKEVEKQLHPDPEMKMLNVKNRVVATLTKSLVRITDELPVKAIVIDSQTGRTGRYLSAFRPNAPIYAKCYQTHVMRELALSYGIYPFYMEKRLSRDIFVRNAVQSLLDDKFIRPDDLLGILGGNFGDKQGATFIEVSTADKLANSTEIATGHQS